MQTYPYSEANAGQHKMIIRAIFQTCVQLEYAETNCF